jgi:hypothetical protein
MVEWAGPAHRESHGRGRCDRRLRKHCLVVVLGWAAALPAHGDVGSDRANGHARLVLGSAHNAAMVHSENGVVCSARKKNTYRLAKTKQPRRNDTWMNSGHIKDRSPVITRAFNMPFCNAKHVRTHYTATIMHTPMKAATPSRPEVARSSYDVARSSYDREDRENLVRGICGPKLGDKYIN